MLIVMWCVRSLSDELRFRHREGMSFDCGAHALGGDDALRDVGFEHKRGELFTAEAGDATSPARRARVMTRRSLPEFDCPSLAVCRCPL